MRQLLKLTLPAPLTILMIVVVLAAASTWLLPAGQYNKLTAEHTRHFILHYPDSAVQLPFTQHTLDSLSLTISLQKFINGDIRKAVTVPGTYTRTDRSPQGFYSVLKAPIRGIIDSIDIVLFILMIGGFIYVFNKTGAIQKGIEFLAFTMKGREPVLIVLLIFIFSLLRATYGMEEEALVFIPILAPLLLAAGYDLLVPVAIVFGGTSVGGIAALTNPFSTIIASNAAGINWMDGIYERAVLLVIATSFFAWYVLRYAARVKKDPGRSLVLKIDGIVKAPFDTTLNTHEKPVLAVKTKLLLLIYLLTFVSMIVGIILFNWWTVEMSALFLGASILTAIITRMKEKEFLSAFITGAETLLSVAFIVGVARGITIVLNEGNVTDSILFYASGLVKHVPPALFILGLMVFYFIFSLFISSSSGIAVLTMPVIGALAILANIPGREVVNSYLFGVNLMFFFSPTSLVLPSLAMANLSYKVWMRFITPVLLVLFVLCSIFLLVGINR